jgi:excisionase family DNA binding protein
MEQEASQNPISVSVRTATRLSGLGRTRLYDAIGSGEIASVRIGRRRLISFESLRRFLTSREPTEQQLKTRSENVLAHWITERSAQSG